jgi:hypothetical protein
MSSAFLYLGNTSQDSLQIRIQFKAIYTWAFGFIYISSYTTVLPSSFNNTLLLVYTSFSYTIRYRIFEHDSNSIHFHSLLPTSTSTLQHFNTSTLQYFNTSTLQHLYTSTSTLPHFYTSTSLSGRIRFGLDSDLYILSSFHSFLLLYHITVTFDSDSIQIHIYFSYFIAFFCYIIL